MAVTQRELFVMKCGITTLVQRIDIHDLTKLQRNWQPLTRNVMSRVTMLPTKPIIFCANYALKRRS